MCTYCSSSADSETVSFADSRYANVARVTTSAHSQSPVSAQRCECQLPARRRPAGSLGCLGRSHVPHRACASSTAPIFVDAQRNPYARYPCTPSGLIYLGIYGTRVVCSVLQGPPLVRHWGSPDMVDRYRCEALEIWANLSCPRYGQVVSQRRAGEHEVPLQAYPAVVTSAG